MIRPKSLGILTFHSAINYGAILQAYALQNTVGKILPNSLVQIIDFKTKKHVKNYKYFIFDNTSLFKNIALAILTLRILPFLILKKFRFKNFTKLHLNLSERFFSEKQITNSPPAMDVYITGSDQVFNPHNPFFKTYYLSFNKKKVRKIAYAPSFGVSSFNDRVKNKVKGFIKDFDYLSCRETSGAQFLSQIVGENVPSVLDPVFLLNEKEWLTIASRKRVKGKYIFVYDLVGRENLISIAKNISKHTGYKIVCLTKRVTAFYKVDKQIYSSGPKEFVTLIANAEYVVTDSFHGTAFSILFDKPFFTYIAIEKSSSRIRSLLSRMNLEQRIIENGMSCKFDLKKYTITKNYKTELLILKKESLQFLKNSLV